MQGCWVTLGQADRQGDLLDDVTRFCDEALPESSIYAVLHRERDWLFPDGMFADLFSEKGRRSVRLRRHGVGPVRAHGAGGYAGPAGEVARSAADLRGDPDGGGRGGAGR